MNWKLKSKNIIYYNVIKTIQSTRINVTEYVQGLHSEK